MQQARNRQLSPAARSHRRGGYPRKSAKRRFFLRNIHDYQNQPSKPNQATKQTLTANGSKPLPFSPLCQMVTQKPHLCYNISISGFLDLFIIQNLSPVFTKCLLWAGVNGRGTGARLALQASRSIEALISSEGDLSPKPLRANVQTVQTVFKSRPWRV